MTRVPSAQRFERTSVCKVAAEKLPLHHNQSPTGDKATFQNLTRGDLLPWNQAGCLSLSQITLQTLPREAGTLPLPAPVPHLKAAYPMSHKK